MTKDRILEELRKIRDITFKNPEIAQQFQHFNKTIQLTFPDIDVDVFMQIGNGAVDALGVGIAESELEVTMDSELFFGILAGAVHPKTAYSSGKIKIRGEVSQLLELEKLLQ